HRGHGEGRAHRDSGRPAGAHRRRVGEAGLQGQAGRGLKMPRQNRVTPFGDIIATPDRGTFMGNRGVLHDAEGRIKRAWQLKRWIVCVLDFKGRKRRVMTPGRYTELFFLDEATALAAGHRPCFACRWPDARAFAIAWACAFALSPPPRADAMDGRLHAERLVSTRTSISFPR